MFLGGANCMSENSQHRPNSNPRATGYSRDEHLKGRRAYWRNTAGDAYPELVRSKDAAMAQMRHPDPKVRITAISMCDIHWKCSGESTFRAALQELVVNDPDESVRRTAIDSLGGAFRKTQDPVVSHLLADLAARADLSQELRRIAYWALREVQLGMTPLDLVKRRIRETKLLYDAQGARGVPAAVKRSLLRGGRVPKSVWESAGEIDLEFVNRVLSSGGRG
jgi:hypothetical protein